MNEPVSRAAGFSPPPAGGALGVLRNHPKTWTAVVTAVAMAASAYGLNLEALRFLSMRQGAEYWQVWKSEGGLGKYVYEPIEAQDQQPGMVVLAIEWTGEGRDIEQVLLYRVANADLMGELVNIPAPPAVPEPPAPAAALVSPLTVPPVVEEGPPEINLPVVPPPAGVRIEADLGAADNTEPEP